jgi:hypothetical protein
MTTLGMAPELFNGFKERHTIAKQCCGSFPPAVHCLSILVSSALNSRPLPS